jgi:signal transduction histidine kinase
MKGGFWVNPEIKRVVIGLLTVNITLFIVFSLFLNYYWNSLNKKLIYQNIGTIGTLISRYPELKKDIISAYTKEASSSEIERGISEAQKYGYNADLPLKSNDVLNSYSKGNFSSLCLFAIFYFFITMFVVIINFKKIFRRLDYIALASEKIVEGDFTVGIHEEGEGTLSKLGHQFNQMSNRLQFTLDELKSEKLYLKDTISDISHQLKTPLTALKMLNDLLIEGAVEKKEKRDEFLQRSKVQLERMEWLILNLLKLARIEAGTIEFKNENTSLISTAQEAVSELSVNWKEKKQRIDIIIDNQDVVIFHDRQWLKEAFSNIIKNSIEHTGEGGTISIKLVETPVMVRINIQDNGEGILRDDLPYIFKRFYRGKNSIYGKGTGIGLALAKSIIENQNGIITVKSSLNEGTTFSITFLKNGC